MRSKTQSVAKTCPPSETKTPLPFKSVKLLLLTSTRVP